MKTSDPMSVESIKRLINDASQDQIQRLLNDIAALGDLPAPTHTVTERLQ